MIFIISGKQNQGKTKKIKSIYLEEKKGDGFITQKIFRDSAFYGYEIIRLSTGESRIQSVKSELFPDGISPLYRCGAYSFYSDGFSFADSVIDDIISKGTNPVFIDEIGPLELEGRGHYNCLIKILNSSRTVYFTIRNSCLENVIKSFSIKDYSLIEIK